MHVFENDNKGMMATKSLWFIDATEDWQQECVESLTCWIGAPHDIWLFASMGSTSISVKNLLNYEMAVWLPDSNRDSFDAVDSKLSIHPWRNNGGPLGTASSDTPFLRLDEHDSFLAVMQLVMDLILRGLHLQEGHARRQCIQNMMYAAGTSRSAHLKVVNVNFGVDIGFEQPASDVDQHECHGSSSVTWKEHRIADEGWRSPFVLEHPNQTNVGRGFSRMGPESLELETRTTETPSPKWNQPSSPLMPRGLTHYAKVVPTNHRGSRMPFEIT